MSKRKIAGVSGILAAVLVALFAAAAFASPQFSNINVSTVTDEYNTSGAGTGCSLREAITTANNDAAFGGCTISGTGNLYINVPPGTFKITLSGKDGDAMDNSIGDFDVKTNVTIHGSGRGLTFIDAQGKDRIFDLDFGTRVELNSMTLQNGNIQNVEDGSAIRARGYNANLIYLIVQNNTNGVAIYNKTGDISLYRLVVQNNDFGSNPGPGGIVTFGVLRINQSLFYNNHGFSGGAIAAYNTSLIVNSTLSGNRAEYRGGGIDFGSADYPIFLDLSNVTITGNHANLNNQFTSGGGGGVSSWDSGDQVYMRNSIIAGNVDEGIKTQGTVYFAPDCIGKFTSNSYNLVGDYNNCDGFTNGVNHDKVGTHNSPLNAKLGPLANNGGFTHTHALLTGSPAVDAGNYQGCKDRDGNLLVTDQRGYARPIDGDGNPGAWCDMGAYEAASPGYPTPTPTVQSCNAKPGAPTLNTPTNGGTVTLTHVALDWDGVTCATKYKVLVRQDSTSGVRVDRHTVSPSRYITVKLQRKHDYFWRVKACNASGCTKSVWFEFTIAGK